MPSLSGSGECVPARRLDRLTGPLAALLWVLAVYRWFTVADDVRPGWLSAVPLWALAGPALVAVGFWLRRRGRGILDPLPPGAGVALVLILVSTAAFRLPVVFQGAAGAVTPDGALSGIVALHVRDGLDRHVFVPMVPYSGSLKSHLTAALATGLDPAVAFASASLLFYLLFVAATCHLAARAGREVGQDESAAVRLMLAAGLYLAFSPPYLTRYSLSNDGNYVEVLGLGTWALVLAVRVVADLRVQRSAAWLAGVLLGLAFWCHILALIPLLVVGLVLVAGRRLRAATALGRVGLGWALGYAPGLLWNALNDWASFRYLLPGFLGGESVPMGEELAVPLGPRFLGLLQDQLPFLLGYDPGHPWPVDLFLRGLSWLVVALVLAGLAVASWRFDLRKAGAGFALVALFLVTVGVAFLGLPQIPGNPRYLQPAMASVAVFLPLLLLRRRLRPLLVLIVAAGALASFGQMRGTFDKDRKWRDFVSGLEGLGVRHCYTDFFLATNINFLSEERVVCTGKLGPTMTEYFFEYRGQVERAPSAALVAVNRTAASRLETKLSLLGVTYTRADLMKPVLHGLSRKVDPEELFPGREFPRR